MQRTNQLNFSGNRYSRERIEELLHDPNHELFVVDCNDKYGTYGTVGFALVDLEQCALLDLMLSCRVQSKRVEHALFGFLLHHYKRQGQKIFTAFYIMTDRNSKAGAVFKDMNFVEQAGPDGKKRYTYKLDDDIPMDGVITILWEGEPCNF